MMRRIWMAAFLAAAVMMVAGPATAGAQVVLNGKTFRQTTEGWVLQEGTIGYPVEPGVVTVRLAEGVDGMEAFRSALAASGGDTELGQLPVIRVNRLGIYDLRLMPNQDPLDIARRLQETGLVRYAEPNTVGVWSATPSDPRFPDQWHLRNTGQNGGTPDADMDDDEAWDMETGSSAIVVAIVDSGVDIDHVDLVDNLWKNTGEIPNNGKDDDANGYVDDYDGWDFEGNDGDPRSTNGHGTNVSGIVAARTDNGTGVSGIAGGFGASGGSLLMPLKVGTAGPNGAVLDDAIIYAADNGAQIITMSLSVGETQAINDALDYAYNQRGVFIDCASGNNYASTVSYPARRPEVMAVGATDHNDARAAFSNYGTDLEVVAPGVDVLTTGLNNSYQTNSGTSFSAPCTAGTAALLFSYNGTLTNVQVRQTLKDTADDVGAPGQDLETGYGRINARAALDATPGPDCVDGDGDGFYPTAGCGTEIDCNDSDPTIYPGAPEICRDGVDQDCDGADKTKGKGCHDGGGGGAAVENCKNHKDDDGDGLVDCLDPDCVGNKACN